MRDFKKFMEENRDKLYKIAYANCKHDAEGHCLFPSDDPWMKDAEGTARSRNFDPKGAECISIAEIIYRKI